MQIPQAGNRFQFNKPQEPPHLLVTSRGDLWWRRFRSALPGGRVEINDQRLIACNPKLRPTACGSPHRGRSIPHALLTVAPAFFRDRCPTMKPAADSYETFAAP